MLLLAWCSWKFYRNAKSKRLSKNGVRARAVLLDIHFTGAYINSLPQVHLQMQVFSKTGRNFVTEVCEAIDLSDLDHLQIGQVMEIKYNPSNVREVLLIKGSHQ